jgi:CheY-like chemotaxis protein
MAKRRVRRTDLKLAILNDSEPVLKMLCDWFTRQGHRCVTAVVADMPNAHEDIARFVTDQQPDVVVYDVAMPYASSWDLIDVVRAKPALQSQPFVLTTPNKKMLEEAVGHTSTLEIGGHKKDLRRLLKAVEGASRKTTERRALRSKGDGSVRGARTGHHRSNIVR